MENLLKMNYFHFFAPIFLYPVLTWLSYLSCSVYFSALEGYLLYRALVVIFDTGDHRGFPLYIFGYGMPLLLATATFIVALVVSEGVRFEPMTLESDYFCQV